MCRQNHCCAVDYFAIGVIGYEFMLGRVRTNVLTEISDPIMGKPGRTSGITYLPSRCRSDVTRSPRAGP